MSANNPDEGEESPSSHDSSNDEQPEEDFTQEFEQDGSDNDDDESVTDHTGIPFGGDGDDDADVDEDTNESQEDEKPEGNAETDGVVGATVDSSTSASDVSVPDDTNDDGDNDAETDSDDDEATDNSEETEDGGDGDEPTIPSSDAPTVKELRKFWRSTPGEHPLDWVRTQSMVNRYARSRTCDYLEENYDIIYVGESDERLPALYIYNSDEGIFEDEAEDKLGSIIEDLLPHAASDGAKREIISKLEDRNKVDIETLNARDREHTYRCLENGVLDIDTWELHDHSPEFRMVTKMNARWEPDVDTTEVREFIESIIPEKYRDTVIELLGDILTDHYESKSMPILYGPSNGGKSKLLDLIGAVVGEDNRSAETLRALASEKWASASLVNGVGVMVNLADEVEGKRIEHTSQIKKLVGGSEMEHENKFGDPFYKLNTTKLWNVTNHPPVIEDEQDAMANRIVPIECPHTFVSDPDPENPYEKEKEEGILDRLDTEENRAAMLQVMAEGLKRLREQDWEVSLDETPDERLDRYNNEADTVYSFGIDCLYETAATNQYDGSPVFLKKQEVYQMYVNYCDAKGASALRENVFFRKLNQGGSVAYGVNDSPGKTLPNGDREPALTGVAPTVEGWEHVARPEETLSRFEAHVADDADVPMPGDDEPAGPQANPDGFFDSLAADVAADGGRDALEATTRVIGRLNSDSSSEAEELAVLQACDDELDGKFAAREVIEMLDTLEEGDVIEQDDDGVYHVVEDDVLDDSEDDGEDGVDEDLRDRVLTEVASSADDEGVRPPVVAGNLQEDADEVLSVMESLVDDDDLERKPGTRFAPTEGDA